MNEEEVYQRVSSYFKGARTIEERVAMEQACATNEALRLMYHEHWVLAYLGERLRDDEKERFEAEVNANQPLNDLLEQHRQAIQSVDQLLEGELRGHFAEWNKEKQEKNKHFFPLGIAASLVLLISSYLLFFNQSGLSREAAVLKYYQLPQAPSASMGEEDALWSQGIAGFKQSDFMTAIINWEQIAVRSAEQNYFLAHAYFNKQEHAKASSLFAELSTGSSAYSFSADWYLFLSALQSNDQQYLERSKQVLKSDSHPFYKDYQELLEDLE